MREGNILMSVNTRNSKTVTDKGSGPVMSLSGYDALWVMLAPGFKKEEEECTE